MHGSRILNFFLILLTNNFVRAGGSKATLPPTKPPEATNTHTIPEGIFSTTPLPFDRYFYAYDYSDVYIPNRSDHLDNFSWQLLKTVLEEATTTSNVVISPFSVKFMLAMLAEAAGNNTQTQRQLIAALEQPKSLENLHDFYKNILASLRKQTPYATLNLETKMFADLHLKPRQSYAAKLAKFYNTDIERLNFKEAQMAANHINSWCQSATNGHLQNLVNQADIQSSVLLLANVLYFNGWWLHQFKQTYEGSFFTTPETPSQVQYMSLTDYFYYFEDSSWNMKMLRLPYKGNRFSMFILLANSSKEGAEQDLLKMLQSQQVKRMQFLMEETKLKVILPKFKFEYDKNLKNTLSRLGIQDIFGQQASLPGLVATGAVAASKLKVSDVIQKSGINVNEKGTEAYAATVFEFASKFGGSPVIPEFTVDRPFIFFIEEEATGSILFAGKVSKPVV